jgi:ribose transport system substrate-binding protein
LAPFARLDQVCHIFTDDQLDPTWIERLRATAASLSLCGEGRVDTITPGVGLTPHVKIGFANLGEQLAYAADVRRSLERAAQAVGGIDLIVADNRLDSRVALEVAGTLIAERVDLAIEYQLDHAAGDVIMAKFQDAGIPVIAVDIPMVGATYYGVDNYRAGHMAGVALGQWIARHWDGHYDRLIVLERRRAGPLAAARMRGQADGLASVLGPIPDDAIIALDCSEGRAETEAQVMELLRSLPVGLRLAVTPHSDTLALAAAEIGRALGRQADMAIVSQGADREVCAEMTRPDSPIIGGTAYYPEKYGEQLVTLALRILRGERVPPAVYIDHAFISRCEHATGG